LSGKDYFQSRIQSIQYALDGIKYALVTQQNTKIHALFTIVVIVLGFLLEITKVEWITLFLTIGLVWMAELFNTAIEALVDLISPEHHNTAKICKDVSAGSVMVSALISILVGLLIFGPPLWRWVIGLIK